MGNDIASVWVCSFFNALGCMQVSMCRRNGKVVYFSHYQHVIRTLGSEWEKITKIALKPTRPSSICPRVDFSHNHAKVFCPQYPSLRKVCFFFAVCTSNRQTSENFILQCEMKLTSLCHCRHHKILYYFSKRIFLYWTAGESIELHWHT